MRIKFLAFAASLLLISNSSVGIPQTPSAAPSAPQRDPQALTVIAQMTAATGWTTGSIPPTIVASGTLTRPGASPQAPESFVLKQRGSTQHRFDRHNHH